MKVLARSALIFLSAASCALAQPYPSKTVRFISPFPPGGGTDLIARILASSLTERLGQNVVIDNRGGAQGSIGTELAAAAAPDGYTIVLSSTPTFAMNPWLYKVGYHPVRDFAQISLATLQPYIVVVNPKVAATNLKELASLAKAKPDSLSFGSSSAGGQLAGEFFKLVAQAKMVHVPYKGAGPATIDLMGGHIDLMFASPAGAIQQVKAGKLRALAVTTSARIPALPETLTSKESGFPELEINTWYGVAAPAKMPREVVNRLNAEITRILADNSLKEKLAMSGLEPKGNSPQDMSTLVKTDFERWGKVVKASGMKVE